MKKIVAMILFGTAFVLLGLSYFKSGPKTETIRVRCPDAFLDLVTPVARQYEAEFGHLISIGESDPDPGDDLVFGLQSELENTEVKELIPILRMGDEILQIGVLKNCPQPAAALRFARYLASPEKGGLILKRAGEVIPGDAWAVKPDLILYSGGVNRPAVENLLKEFSEREGVDLTTIFNGCGILCAAMKTMSNPDNPRFPDAYFACDLCFVPPVAEHFDEVILLTETDIGIAVPKENPHGIKTLTDLAKPGLKVGLCNQEQSTLGYMTRGILRSAGLETSIRKNVVVEVPTADFLITQIRSGALDAAIVYRVNAQLQKEHIAFLKIKHEGARAVQPFSVRSDSNKRQLAKRLQDHFLSHPEAFEETGFTWRGDESPIKSSEIEVPEWLRGKSNQ